MSKNPITITMRLVLPLCCLLGAARLDAAIATDDVLRLVSQRWYEHHLEQIPTGPDAHRDFVGDPPSVSADHEATRQLLVDHFTAQGWTTRVDELSIDGYLGGSNIVATRLGSSRPDEIYLLGAHYDSAHNGGYADNATGVAALMEAARVLAFVDCEATMVLVAFDAEEFGLRGSHRFAHAAIQQGDDIRGVLNLDMIGHNHAGNDRAWVGRIGDPASVSEALQADVLAAVERYAENITAIGGILGSSDHAAFDVPGVREFPAVQFTEERDPDNSNRPFNPNYHQASDHDQTPGNVDTAYATDLTRVAIGWLADAAVLVDRRQPPLTSFARIQPIQVARNDGSDVVNAAEKTFAPFAAQVYAQAGIAIEHRSFNRIDDSRIWQIDDAPIGTVPDPRVIGIDGVGLLAGWEVMDLPGLGKSSDPLDLNMYFIRATTGGGHGMAVISGNVFFIRARTIGDPNHGYENYTPVYDTIPHEMGHCFFLHHTDDLANPEPLPEEESPQHLMQNPRDRPDTVAAIYHADDNPDGTSILSFRQMARVLESPYVRPLPLAGAQTPTAVAQATGPTYRGETITLDASASTDPGGAELSFSWQQTAGPTVTIAQADQAIANVIPDSLGSYSFTVTVDNGSRQATAVVNVSIVNRAPTLSGLVVADDPVTGTTTVASVTAEDADDDPLALSWTVADQPSGVSPPVFDDDQAASPTVTFFAAGAYQLQVTVDDGSDSSAATLPVTVGQTPSTIQIQP